MGDKKMPLTEGYQPEGTPSERGYQPSPKEQSKTGTGYQASKTESKPKLPPKHP
jgi:hypothetical protein